VIVRRSAERFGIEAETDVAAHAQRAFRLGRCDISSDFGPHFTRGNFSRGAFGARDTATRLRLGVVEDVSETCRRWPCGWLVVSVGRAVGRVFWPAGRVPCARGGGVRACAGAAFAVAFRDATAPDRRGARRPRAGRGRGRADAQEPQRGSRAGNQSPRRLPSSSPVFRAATLPSPGSRCSAGSKADGSSRRPSASPSAALLNAPVSRSASPRTPSVTWLGQATGDACLVAAYLGHADLSTVSRYAHVAADELHGAAALIAARGGFADALPPGC
jgi:hypothetical protein